MVTPSLTSLVWYSGVDGLGRDLADPADPVDAIGPDDHGRRLIDLGREERLQECFIRLGVVSLPPADVAALRGTRRVGRNGLGDVFPGGPGRQVGQRGVSLGLGGVDLGLGRFECSRIGDRLDLDHPEMPLLRRRRVLGESGVDLLGRRGDAFVGGKLRLEPRIDESLERDRLDLPERGGDGLLLLGTLGLGHLASRYRVRDAATGLGQAPAVDGDAVAQVVLGDGLTVDAADRCEVFVVVVQSGRDEEHGDAHDDDDPESDVEVEVPSVLRLPRGSVGALDDGLGTKGHGPVDSCHMAGRRRGWRAAVWYTGPSKGRDRSVISVLPPESKTG